MIGTRPEELPDVLRALLAEVRTDRAELETLLAQVNEAGAQIPNVQKPLAAAVSGADAEQRLARLDRLLGEVHQGLQKVQSEKALVDRVSEQSERLAFQLKQAEALVAALKKERDLVARLRDGGAPKVRRET